MACERAMLPGINRRGCTMSETIGQLLAAGNVAEVFKWGSRVVKLYRSPARKPTAFREAAIHAAVEAMALPVPAVWGVLEVGGRGVSSNASNRSAVPLAALLPGLSTAPFFEPF